MIFSKSCEYGIRAALFIARNHNENRNTSLKLIARETGVPIHFLSKILQILVKYKILRSTRGLTGGFVLNKKPENIDLLSIINAIDGMDIFDSCVIGLKECSDLTPCPVHEQYKPLKAEFLRILTNKTLKDLIVDLEHGKTFLNLK